MSVGVAYVPRANRGRTTQKCSQCGVERAAAGMRSTRVPGVGTVYTCKGQHGGKAA